MTLEGCRNLSTRATDWVCYQFHPEQDVRLAASRKAGFPRYLEAEIHKSFQKALDRPARATAPRSAPVVSLFLLRSSKGVGESSGSLCVGDED